MAIDHDRTHRYAVTIEWTGDRGTGTSGYRAYGRDHWVTAPGKPPIAGSSDPAFRGDPARWNPEELFVASLSSCHQLWYLHLCAEAGVRVLAYRDDACGSMVEDATGGRMTLVVLRPAVTIHADDDAALATRLHHDAHDRCFIANSVSVPVECRPVVERQGAREAIAPEVD